MRYTRYKASKVAKMNDQNEVKVDNKEEEEEKEDIVMVRHPNSQLKNSNPSCHIYPNYKQLILEIVIITTFI